MITCSLCGKDAGANYKEVGSFKVCGSCNTTEKVLFEKHEPASCKFIKLYKDALLPQRSTSRSAGYDLHAYEPCIIAPHETKLIKTGVTFKVEGGLNVSLDVCSRSGLALKQNIFVLNAPGIVDADYYPNEIGVILHNLGDHIIKFKKGDRVAQAKIVPFLTVSDDKAYGDRNGGFGSTGGV
jgi:dUTP pyrophosphatase